MELEEFTMHILIQCSMQKKAKVTWMKLDLLTWLLEVRHEHENYVYQVSICISIIHEKRKSEFYKWQPRMYMFSKKAQIDPFPNSQ